MFRSPLSVAVRSTSLKAPPSPTDAGTALRARSGRRVSAFGLTWPQQGAAVGAIGLLHLLAVGWLLRPSPVPAPNDSREATIQLDWITAAAPPQAPATVSLPVPAVLPVRRAHTPPRIEPVVLLTTVAEAATETGMAARAELPVALPAIDDGAAAPAETATSAPSSATAVVAGANTPSRAETPTQPPKTLPAESIRYLVPPAPVYPRLSRRLGESGQVLVRVYIDEAGLPRSVQIGASSGHARLDDAALQAVLQARFKPYAENGRPTAGWAFIPLTFDLEK